jgi:hypothetical protein
MASVSTWIRLVLFLYSDWVRIHSTALFSSFLAQHYCTSLRNFLDPATMCWFFSSRNFTAMYCVLQLSRLCYILPRYPVCSFLDSATLQHARFQLSRLCNNVLCFSAFLPLLHLTSLCSFLDSATVQRAHFPAL